MHFEQTIAGVAGVSAGVSLFHVTLGRTHGDMEPDGRGSRNARSQTREQPIRLERLASIWAEGRVSDRPRGNVPYEEPQTGTVRDQLACPCLSVPRDPSGDDSHFTGHRDEVPYRLGGHAVPYKQRHASAGARSANSHTGSPPQRRRRFSMPVITCATDSASQLFDIGMRIGGGRWVVA